MRASVIAISLVIAISVGGCGIAHGSCGHDRSGLPTCPVSVAVISAHPESVLAYPGSTRWSHNAQAENDSIFGKNPADASNSFAVKAPIVSVYTWYGTWLRAHGWHYAGAPLAVTGSEVSGEAYVRGIRESFTIDENRFAGIYVSGNIPIRLRSETLYDTVYLIEPYRR